MAVIQPRLKRLRPTHEIVDLFPAQGEWTEEEYLALDTNRLIELSNGKLEALPMPSDFHQLIVMRLAMALFAFVTVKRLGQVRCAPLRVRLGAGKFREPDLMFVAAAHDDRRGEQYWQPPDLVVEVISPDDRRRVRVVKRREYAQAGIPEYWLIDPEASTVEVHLLQDQDYKLERTLKAGDELTSTQVPGWGLAVAELFKAADEG
jgi:Uma2 family endonuclease